MSWQQQPPPQQPADPSGWGPPPGGPPTTQQRRQAGGGGANGQQQQQQQQWNSGAPSTAPAPPAYGGAPSYGGPPPAGPPPAYGYGGVPPAGQYGQQAPQQQAWTPAPPAYGAHPQQAGSVAPASSSSAAAAAAAAAALGAALGGVGVGGGPSSSSDPYQFAAGLAVDALRAGGGAAGVFERGAALFKGGWLGALTRGGSGGGGSGTGDGMSGVGPGGGPASPGGAHPSAGGGRFALFGLGTSLHVSSPYVRSKLALLATPWARRWTYTRVREVGAGGGGAGPYAPPARDVHAPDLYIPLMAALTTALLRGVAAVAAGKFSPDTLAAAVSGVFSVWALHTAALKGALWALGAAAAAPLAEVVAFAGYPAVHGAAACAVRAAADWRVVQQRAAAGGLAALAGGGDAAAAAGAPPAATASAAAVAAAGGGWGPALATAYGATAAGVFLVRSLKRVLFQDARRAGGGGGGSPAAPTARSNYILLLVWALQWPLVWWTARACRIPVPKR